jgi:copper resistance protein B
MRIRESLLAALLISQPVLAQEHHEQHQHPEPTPNEITTSEPTASELKHVPPEPAQHPMSDMSNAQMIELMEMDDTAAFAMTLFDELEWQERNGQDVAAWDAQAWFGNDYDKVWLKTEGEHVDGESDARTELLWDRIVSPWWSLQAGVRHDLQEGPSRTWAALGVQGLAPYWFELEATLYVGEDGRTALRASGEYELLLTQRLILQPQIEINMYGKEDPSNGIGAGVADLQLGARLRYEIRRKFAPYVGIEWSRAFGDTADFARAAGQRADDVHFVAGVRAWF